MMPQIATVPTLTAHQERALAVLLAGRTVTDAAAEAEVDRSTVHRWVKADYAFQAALNRGRRELRDTLQARLIVLAEKAAECVERSISEGDVKTALAVLRGLGLLSGRPLGIGSDDPAELEQDAQQAERFRELCR